MGEAPAMHAADAANEAAKFARAAAEAAAQQVRTIPASLTYRIAQLPNAAILAVQAAEEAATAATQAALGELKEIRDMAKTMAIKSRNAARIIQTEISITNGQTLAARHLSLSGALLVARIAEATALAASATATTDDMKAFMLATARVAMAATIGARMCLQNVLEQQLLYQQQQQQQ